MSDTIERQVDWTVWGLDVWAYDDGWAVNDSFRVGYVSLPVNDSEHDAIVALKDQGFLEGIGIDEVSIDGDDMMLNVDVNGKPYLRLELA